MKLRLARLFRLPARLRVWHASSMAHRITVAAMLLSMSIVLVVGATAYLSLHLVLEEELEDRLSNAASLARQRLHDQLERNVRGVGELARRSLVANALIDSQGRGGYLRPFLHEHQRSNREILEIGLYNWDGEPLASSMDQPVLHHGLVESVVKTRRTMAWLVHRPQGYRLLVVAPVVLPATGTVEGALISEISLSLLASQALENTPGGVLLDLLDTEGYLHYQSSGGYHVADLIQVAMPLGDAALAGDLGLRLVASMPRQQAEWPLRKLQGVFAALALLAALATYWGARSLARHVTEPLARLSDHAQEIASDGPAGLRELEVLGHDEVSWTAMAFNAMVRSLQQVYAVLEDRVRERTHELERRELYLRAILDNFPFMIWLKDEHSRFLAVNQVMADTCGQTSPAAMVGMTDGDIWPAELAARYQTDDLEVMAGKVAKVVEEPVLDQCTRKWFETYKKPVMDGAGRVLGSVGFSRDVTERKQAEEAMRLRDRAIMSTIDGIVIADMTREGQPVIFANAAFETITGYAFSEVEGRNCSMLQGQERAQPALDELRLAIASGRECRVVLRNYRKQGDPFWNELTLSPVRDDQGRVTHYIGIQHDISEAVSAREKLADSERRLALTIDALRDGLWDWSIPTGQLYQSPSWAGMLGYAPEELSGDLEAYLRCLPEDEKPRVLEQVQAHLAGKSEAFICEHRMLRKDGSEIWVSDRGRVVEWGEDGQPIRMVGTISDISERMRAEQEMFTWMLRLDSILTLSPDAYVYFDDKGRVATVNVAFERMTGLLSGDVMGRGIGEFVARLEELADPGQPFPNLARVFMDEIVAPTQQQSSVRKGLPTQITLNRPTKRVLTFDLRVNDSDGSSVLYLRDMTRETEVDRMKSEFLSTAAHELRTPMASIMGFSELLLLRDYRPEVARDLLETIHRQAKRLTDLLNELLDLARIESRAGKDFKFTVQPLEPVIRDSVAASQGGACTLKVVIEDALPPLGIDAAKLQQALLNILSNAAKYSPRGGEVEIRAGRRQVGQRQRACIQVSDHGIGMTPEQTARVFERFFRADPSGNIPGTGLGMSLVKEIMELHGGGVEVESTPGTGTMVTLWLPLPATTA
jgi:PAS domain S-box-containing protein